MYTVCPKCALTLVVTAADLKVGQGFVRCGRCSNVFNALVGLTEDRQGARSARGVRSGSELRGRTTVAEDRAPGSPVSEDPDSVPDSALEFRGDAAELAEVFIEPRPGPHDVASGTFETIVLDPPATSSASAPAKAPARSNPASSTAASSAPASPSGDNPPPIEHAANDSDAAALQAANDAAIADAAGKPAATRGFDRERIERPLPRTAPSSASASPPAGELDSTSASDETLDPVEIIAPPRQSRLAVIGWSAGSVFLLALLAAQLIHEHRAVLALDSRLRAPLFAAYEALGLPLVPRWDLAGYEVRQLGATAGASNGRALLTVRASVQNDGEHPQPLPLLRVTVQDRYGNRLAARDVPPTVYAARIARGGTLLDAGARVDAEIRLADPGPNAVGFELDACLALEGGAIACANEQRSR